MTTINTRGNAIKRMALGLVIVLLLAACASGPAATPGVAENPAGDAPEVISESNDESAGDTSVQPTPLVEPTPVPASPAATDTPETTVATEPAAPTDTPLSPPTSTPVQNPADTPAPDADAVVNSPSLNMRRGPGTAFEVVGNYSQGSPLKVLGRTADSSWIKVRASDGKEGWMASNLMTLNMALSQVAVAQAPQAPTAPPPAPQAGGAISAPVARSHESTTFSWAWNGGSQMGNQDWYFDIQIFQGSSQDPYQVLAAEPGVASFDNGVWYFDADFQPFCDSVWVVQIAKRDNGRFSGWTSPKSNRSPVGSYCVGSGDSGPAPTSCPGCG